MECLVFPNTTLSLLTFHIMAKNQLNKGLSSLERSDERIKVTGEVFTPMELCQQMVSEIPKDKIDSGTFLDNAAGSGNFLQALLDSGVSIDRVYCVELMYDNYLEICERLDIKPNNKETDSEGNTIAYSGGDLNFVCANGLNYHYDFDGTHPYSIKAIPKPEIVTPLTLCMDDKL